jgi:chromosome partitioning protein
MRLYEETVVRLAVLPYKRSMTTPKADTTATTAKKKTKTTRRVILAQKKGGSGKTTTTINAADGLAKKGYKVLVGDLDHQANATKNAGFDWAQLRPTMKEILLNPEIPTEQAIVRGPHVGFDLLPSHGQLNQAEAYLMAGQERGRLADKLREVEDRYDFVLLDTPGSETFLTSMAYAYADEVIIPVEPNAFGYDGMVGILDSIRKVRENGLNPKLLVRAILITLYDSRLSVQNDYVKRIQARFGSLVLSAMVKRSVRLQEQVNEKKSIFDYEPNGQGAQAYWALVEHLERG